jgi:hypothetical protein
MRIWIRCLFLRFADSEKEKVMAKLGSGTPEIRDDEISVLDQIGSGCYGKVYRGLCRGKEVRRFVR